LLWCISAALAGCTAIAFVQVLAAGFCNFDDYDYVVENLHVRQGLTAESSHWAFTSTQCSNWHPLTWLSLQLDYQFFGLNPTGFHLTNLLLHVANTVVLFWVLRSYTGVVWRSAAVALLFGIHPLHVESVAWISERKYVLSTFFWLAVMLVYGVYAARPTLVRYLAVVVLFAAGLMAKPMLVTLPCVLLLMDYWPLCRLARATPDRRGYGLDQWRRWRPLVVEKLPIFALSAASCMVTFVVQRSGGSVVSSGFLPPGSRIVNAADAYCAYLAKAAWPLNLSLFYPLQTNRQLMLVSFAEVAVLAALTYWAFHHRQKAPYLFVGWLWFLGTLIPVIGVVQVGVQAFADRYTYVPLIGIFWAVVWGMSDLVGRRILSARIAGLVAAGAFLACGACTWIQVGYWENNIVLWKHALQVAGPNVQAYHMLASALMSEKKYEEALPHLRESVRLNPLLAVARLHLGITLWELGDQAGGERELERAIELDPTSAASEYNLGHYRYKNGKLSQAVEPLQRAIAVDPFYWRAYVDLSKIFSELGLPDKAADCRRAAERINPALLASPKAFEPHKQGNDAPPAKNGALTAG
jgi:tetratricopeptide (TPR) repeat protein